MRLADYAQTPETSKGRLHKEAESQTRTPYARDRDRIIHCNAFRRLKGKTQVFVANEGDYFRTRLTHTLEVAQIARSLASALQAEQDLAEVVALAHDLGHPPFGHAGEEELDKLMLPWDGFDHNVQSFRMVTRLEHRFPAFEGLNLTWEAIEGIIKHNGPVTQPLNKPAWRPVREFSAIWDLRPETYASLEAQIGAIADDIAYNNHDLDDGLKAELFRLSDLEEVPLIGPSIASVRRDWPGLDNRMIRLESVRRVIGTMIADVLKETRRRLEDYRITDAESIRLAPTKMVAFSEVVFADLTRLRAFLYERMYKHYRVNRTRVFARRVISDLFVLFSQDPNILEPQWQDRVFAKESETGRQRVVCDYISGMTDEFALSEHRRLCP